MEKSKLVCPVKRIDNETNLDINVDLQKDLMNVKVDFTTKNIVKSVTDFIRKTFNRGDKNE